MAGPRQLAATVLRRVHRGAFAAPAISSALEGLDDGRDRSLLTDLVYGTLRHQLLIDAALMPRLAAPEKLPPEVLDFLRLGTFELLIRGTPRHAAVSEWVELTKSRASRLGGLANAVLRRVELPRDLGWPVAYSLPDWLAERLVSLLGEEVAERAAAGMLEPEPFWLSGLGPGVAEALREDGCEVEGGPLPDTFAVRCPGPLGATQAYARGLVQPQNPASRLPVLALESQHGERVLDLAAGNGIKTALLSAAGALVTSFELDATKVDRARSNMARLGLQADHRVADLTSPPDVRPAPKVLLDAPCSGTGTLRGHPEIKLRLGQEDVAELAALQSKLLETASALTAPGGRLVYSVCALTPEEGPLQIERFLSRHPEFRPLPLALPLASVEVPLGSITLPTGGLDGFFISSLGRSPSPAA